jgi:hypothetical protein
MLDGLFIGLTVSVWRDWSCPTPQFSFLMPQNISSLTCLNFPSLKGEIKSLLMLFYSVPGIHIEGRVVVCTRRPVWERAWFTCYFTFLPSSMFILLGWIHTRQWRVSSVSVPSVQCQCSIFDMFPWWFSSASASCYSSRTKQDDCVFCWGISRHRVG